MLFVILLTSYYLQSKKIRYLHETVVSIFLGLIIGMVVHFNPKGTLNDLVTFDHTYFFNLLLPPIILNSGYDMKRKHFFRNIGSILTFALIGTVISTIVIGVLVKLAVNFLEITHIHTALNLTMLDCIVFGAILSSTDPVTILSIFHQAKVDPKLYAIIFGESILNDSVAIVLFKVLGKYRASPESFNIIGGIMSFLAIFTGSVMVGVIVALIGALMLKHSRLHEYPSLESSIIILLAYSSYLLSNAVQLSGIVSLLFCGICLRHYGYNNMSIRTRRTTKYMFRVLSQLCENFVFIYLGVTVFTSLKSSLKDEGYRPGLIFFTLFICLFARYVSVIPLAKMINAISARLSGTPGREEIPRNHQLMLWWAGLRGAIAFALSFEVKAEGSENTDKIIQTTTLIICIVTVILLGGTTNMALEKLEIRVGVGKSEGNDGNDFDDDEEDPDTDSSEGESEDWDDDLPGSRSSLYDGTAEDQRSSAESLLERNRSIRVEVDDESRPSRSAWDEDLGHWFISFDNKWLKPLFTRTRWKWGRSRVRRPQSPARGAWNGDSVGRTMGNNNIRGRSTSCLFLRESIARQRELSRCEWECVDRWQLGPKQRES
ncbi:Sodium/hydrogen exchanger family-domain-containing protein [Fimicolochytrium jonesii]|uniref:Sodium/hydrogen exchanger family-domain-containing protein n=1 Tax=Fimicolochytrium jonesii TaxID=1396493 RepID=UPI0022FDEB65|nr:Sodium/hydrogen exchanger family-domain-containing protein [Fimicolochytrium jonesii]KAI8817621.1 Sodium/hydrogen exchanger family-domain-containing protein [Fimicolochytrium jonesii]